jgi:chemotaxis protein MotB
MKSTVLYLLTICLLSSCTLQKKFDALQNDYLVSALENKALKERLDSLTNSCTTEREALNTKLTQMRADSASMASVIASMKQQIQEQTDKFTKSQQDYLKKLKDAGDLNQRSNAELLQMQQDLEKQKMALQQREADLKKLTDALEAREAKIAELDKLLNDQKRKSEALRDAIKKALVDFSAGELSVYTKDGKVYVSMSDKLLFKSGSTVVESKGIDALGKLSDVIKKNPDIQVDIEGHTDNVPYGSNGGVIKDNWDLSLMRSSSVLHILSDKYKVSPKQVKGSGRGEHYPVESNSTPEGRGRNRRTEIILTPQIDKLLNILGE